MPIRWLSLASEGKVGQWGVGGTFPRKVASEKGKMRDSNNAEKGVGVLAQDGFHLLYACHRLYAPQGDVGMKGAPFGGKP